MGDTLNKIRTGSPKLPARIVLHGPGGVGKTSWAAQAPNPVFLLSPGETGLHTLMDSGIVGQMDNIEVHRWIEYTAALTDLTDQKHDYNTLVVDTIDGIEKMCNHFVCETQFGGDWGEKGFGSFQKGNEFVANGPWRQMLAMLDKLRSAKSMRIILLAHTDIANFANPEGPDFNRYVPAMHKKPWGLTFGWADMVLFGYREVAVLKEKGERKARGGGGSTRLMRTEWSAASDAKNRHNLPAEISMGDSPEEAWTNFAAAFSRKDK